MSGYSYETVFDGKMTEAELKDAVYREVLTQCMEQESAGDYYNDSDRKEYGYSPEDSAQEAASFRVQKNIYENKYYAEQNMRENEAVRFYAPPEKQSAIMKRLDDQIRREKNKAHDYFVRHNARNRKSQYIGCDVCGSKVNKNYIPDNNKCPVCGKATFFSDTDLKRLEAYRKNIKNWEEQYKEEERKHATVKWLVWTKFY